MPYDVATAEVPVEPLPPTPSPDGSKDPVLRKRTLRLGEAQSDEDEPRHPQPTQVLQPPPQSLMPAAAEPGPESCNSGEILELQSGILVIQNFQVDCLILRVSRRGYQSFDPPRFLLQQASYFVAFRRFYHSYLPCFLVEEESVW